MVIFNDTVETDKLFQKMPSRGTGNDPSVDSTMLNILASSIHVIMK